MKTIFLSLFFLSATIISNAQTPGAAKQVYQVRSENKLNRESKNLKSALRQTLEIAAEKLPLYDRIVDQYIQSMSAAKSKQDEKDAFILMQKRFDFPMNVNQAFMKKYLSEAMGIGR